MEQFNFLKQEDQERFEALSKESKTATINEAQMKALAIDEQQMKTSSLLEKADLSAHKNFVDVSKAPEEYREYWKEYNRIKALSYATQDKTLAIEAAGGPDILTKLRKSISEFSKKLEAAYPDYKKYATWHILYFSSPVPWDNPNIDFPGDLSVEKFYADQLEKMEKEYPTQQYPNLTTSVP
ncbi:hypothetical protein D4R49_01940 [bacterium]|nr:MAG: hypothetical protein D4R49_01940 [bacterium]